MTEHDFPGLAQLKTTPAVLRGILIILDEQTAEQRPAPDRWSIAEILGHLSHVERLGFRGRLEKMLREDDPYLDPYNPDEHAASGAFGGRTFGESLDEFERERASSLRILASSPAEALDRGGRHGELGPVTVREMMNEWALHDLGHVRQVAEVLRALKYYPEIGPWQREYKMNP